MNIIEKINKIDRIFAKSVEANQYEMIENLDDPVTKSYFIGKLTGQFDPIWFEFAYGQRIISYTDIPEVINFMDADGNVTTGFKNWEGVFPIVEAAKKVSIYPQLKKLLLNLISEYIRLAKERRDDETRNFTVDYHIAKSILLLPIKLVDCKYLEFVFDFGLRRDHSLLSSQLIGPFFSRVLESDKNLAMELLDKFYSPIFEKRLYKAHSIIEDYALEEFSKSASEKLYLYLGDHVVQWSINKLKYVSAEHKFMFSKIELTSLEPDAQNSNESSLNFCLTKLVIGLLSALPLDKLKEQLPTLINLDRHIISRIGFYLIDRNYTRFGHLFFQQDNPLNRFEAKLEIYRLIKRNCEYFTFEEVNIIINWINNLDVDTSEGESEEQYIRYIAYRKLEWYLALEPIHYKFSEKLIQPFNSLKEITEGSQPINPGYDSYFTIRSSEGYSSTNRICGKSAVDVLNILANKEKWDGYNIYGLQHDLKEYVTNSYNEVIKNLNKFEALPISFIYFFVDGFRARAEKGLSIDIFHLLRFFRSLLENRADFWDLTTDGRDKSDSIGMIAWTIKTVVQNNDYNFNIEQIESVIDSLIIMERRYRGTFECLNDDPLTDIMNSTRGKIYDAMITCCISEVKIQNGEPFWDVKIKNLFTERLTNKSRSIEFYWSLGFNIPEISYLDMGWLQKYEELLVEVQDGKYKLPVFYGYLLLSGQLYTNLYELLYSTYLSQIDVEIENSTIARRLVEHIWIAFAIDLDKSLVLLNGLIESGNTQKLSYLIDRIKIEEALQRDEKIRYVWNKILLIVEQSADKPLREKAFEMVYFTELLRDLTATDLDLFNRTISLGKTNINTYRLLKIVEKELYIENYKIAGELLLILLKNLSNEAFFDENKLKEIIEILYQNEKKHFVDKIALEAVMRRNFSVIHTYNSYHQND